MLKSVEVVRMRYTELRSVTQMLIAGVLVAVAAVGTVARPNEMLADPGYRRVLANYFVIAAASDLFQSVEGRWPSDLGELLRSPYIASVTPLVRPADGAPIAQVASGQPVTVLQEGSPIERYARDIGVPGDLVFEPKADGRLILRPLFARDEHGYLRFIQGDLSGPPTPIESRERRLSWQYRAKWVPRVAALDEKGRKAFANCWYINTMISTVTNFGDPLPKGAKALFESSLVFHPRNPYSGAPVKSVPLGSPSAGDFTFAAILDTASDPPKAFTGGISLCYNDSGRIVNEHDHESLQFYLDREAKLSEGQLKSFRKDGSAVVKLVYLE